MRLLFIHGAGGYLEDQDLADNLGSSIGATVLMPPLPDENMSFQAWADPVRGALGAMDESDRVIAHSFGASVLLRVLTEGGRVPKRAVMLAMPDWSPEGWGVAEYAFDGPDPQLALSLHHCRDDEVVPFAHLATNSSRLPSAQVWPHESGGHQFYGLIAELAQDLARAQ
ncbi:MAG: alpha/beta hydrolase [Ornithinimicrobium sp.]